VLSGVAAGVSGDVLPRSRPRPRPRPLRGPRGRVPTEREAPRPLFIVFDAFAGGFIWDVELFVLLEADPEPLAAGTVEAGKLSGGSISFRRGGGSTVRFDPEGAETFGLSAEAEALVSDSEQSSNCEGVAPVVDDEPGKIEGNPRFDGRVGRCFVCSEVGLGGTSVAAWSSGCEGTGVSSTVR
jgi:hypothetical protein